MGHGSGIERVTVFYYHVRERYGMVEFDADMRVLSLEEKPQHPRSYYAVMGLYFYDSDWWASPARSVRSWGSGIMDVNNTYLTYLRARKPMWSDGTRHCMVDTGLMIRSWLAGTFVQTIETWQGLKSLSGGNRLAERVYLD